MISGTSGLAIVRPSLWIPSLSAATGAEKNNLGQVIVHAPELLDGPRVVSEPDAQKVDGDSDAHLLRSGPAALYARAGRPSRACHDGGGGQR